jgi:hypothetical protein
MITGDLQVARQEKHRNRVANFRTAVMIVVGFALLGLTPTRAEAMAGEG